MLENKAWQRRVTAWWTGGLDGRQIRRVESLQPALLPNGRRLRGVMLTPDLCLARDKKFYEVKDGAAFELETSVVLAQYPSHILRQLFNTIARQTKEARKEKEQCSRT